MVERGSPRAGAGKRNYADLERAITAFRGGKVDAQTAARQAGMGYRAFIEELKHRGFDLPATSRMEQRP